MAARRLRRAAYGSSLHAYLLLLEAFVQERIGAPEFEVIFLRLYKNDPELWSPGVFEILESLFGAVDEYCSDPHLREETGGLSDEDLRAAAVSALENLERVIDAGVTF
ncbi:colicin immunity domain-containing protein [Nonomuraea endophytica]|uniref:colicin immunity domain-containing protein n=1 Tax=Nonomuraea endophytica TaxID=714136 RepID=UPI0037C5771D